MQFKQRGTCWLLVAVMIFSPSLVWSAPPTQVDEIIHFADDVNASSKDDEEKSDTDAIDLSYVSSTAFAIAVVYPRRVLTSPQYELLPTEVITAAGIQELGIDPLDIEQISSFVEPIVDPQGPPDFGMVVHFAEAYDIDEILMPLQEEMERIEYRGRPLYRGDHPEIPSYYMPDDTTLLLGSRNAMRSMIEGGAAEGPVADRLQELAGCDIAVVIEVEPVRPLLLEALKEAPPLPPPFGAVFALPNQIAAVQLGVSLTGDRPSQIEIIATSEEAAEQIEVLAIQAIDLAAQMALVEMRKEIGESEDPIEQAMGQYMERMVATISEKARPQRDGDRLFYRTPEGQGSLSVATIGVLVALLLPAVNAAREAARKTVSANNLKQIGLACLNYEATTGHLPARAILDDDGNALLSWRVHILPFIEEGNLYDEFHLDEPWDSEHNLQLVERMPYVYGNPNEPENDGRTHYQLPVGDGTLFEDGEAPSLESITDGTSKTILAVEADTPVIWTKPVDWEVDLTDPLSGVGNIRREGFLALFADTHLITISKTIDLNVLRAILTPDGGEALGGF